MTLTGAETRHITHPRCVGLHLPDWAMFTSDDLHDSEMDETRLREWARAHYVPLAERSLSWPGFALDEMRRMDENQARGCRIDNGAHPCGAPKLLLRVATLSR